MFLRVRTDLKTGCLIGGFKSRSLVHEKRIPGYRYHQDLCATWHNTSPDSCWYTLVCWLIAMNIGLALLTVWSPNLCQRHFHSSIFSQPASISGYASVLQKKFIPTKGACLTEALMQAQDIKTFDVKFQFSFMSLYAQRCYHNL